MSISSINFLTLNQYLQNIKTDRQISRSQAKQAALKESARDVKLMIEPGKKAATPNSSLDLKVVEQSSFNFQFEYQDKQIQLKSANGFYDLQQQKLELTMGVEFYLRSEMNGQIVEQKYKLNLSVSMENTRLTEGAVRLQKEDIGLYVLRIIKTLTDYAKEKDLNVAGLLLDDIQDIAAIKDGKLLEQIFALVSAMYWTKKVLNSEADDCLLYVPRKKENILEISQKEFSEININFSVETDMSASDSYSGVQKVTAAKSEQNQPENKDSRSA